MCDDFISSAGLRSAAIAAQSASDDNQSRMGCNIPVDTLDTFRCLCSAGLRFVRFNALICPLARLPIRLVHASAAFCCVLPADLAPGSANEIGRTLYHTWYVTNSSNRVSPFKILCVQCPGFGGLEQAFGPQPRVVPVGDPRDYQAPRQLPPLRNAKPTRSLRRAKASLSRFQEPFYGGALTNQTSH